MSDSDTIYKTLTSGNHKEVLALLDELQENPMKSSVKSILTSNDELSVILGFGLLLPVYSQGANVRIGEVLGLALYKAGKELFISQQQQNLMLTTVSGYASNYVAALNNQSKYKEVLKFVEDETDFWSRYSSDPQLIGENDYRSFQDNLKSIKVTKVNALIELDRIDEAERLAMDPALEGNWASDIELDRLRRIIMDKKKDVYVIESEEKRKSRITERHKESEDSIRKTLQAMMASKGFGTEMLNALKEASRSPNLDPATRKGFEEFESILTQGESFLQKGNKEINEITLRQKIRRASGIFVDNTPPKTEILASLNQLQEALEQASAIKNLTLVNDSLYGMYLCYSRLGDSSKAADQLIRLRRNLEQTRKGIQDPIQRGGVFQMYPYLFLSSVEHLFKAGRYLDMLDGIEGAKGRAITDTLEKDFGVDAPEFKAWDISVQLQPLLKRERFHYVSYHVDADCCYAVILTTEGQCIANRIDIGKAKIEKFVRLNLNQPEYWYRVPRVNIVKELQPLVAWMDPLIASGILAEGDHICYSTDDLLYLFPISYLPLRGKSVVDWFSFSRIHNAGHLIYLLTGKKNFPASAVTVSVPEQNQANPETFSIIPAELSAMLPTTPLSGETADLDRISASLEGKDLIQFTTHGVYVRSQSPFTHSGLLVSDRGQLPALAADSNHLYGNDGRHLLSPRELLTGTLKKIRFDRAHISMQACVSGYSLEGIAGDAIGLEWAFLQKGASSLLSSFWNIEVTSSNLFFKDFYTEWLRQSGTKAGAFRKAMLNRKRNPTPANEPAEYRWAGFELIGDWR